jgi:hypothetical protein
MAEYLYHAYIYHDTSNVIGVNPVTEAAYTLDFETNYKSQAVEVNDISSAATTFDIVKSYADFKTLIVSPRTWGDVRYAKEAKAYDLYLLTSSPI